MHFRKLLLAATAMATFAAPALAHRGWLVPSTTTLSDTNQYVTIDAAVSNDLFYPDHVAMQPEQIKVWAPDGTPGAIENAAKGRYRTTFDVKIDKPGTWKIGTEQNGVMGSFMLNGAAWRVGRRGPPGATPRPNTVATAAEIPAGATDVKLIEMTGQTVTYVTAGAPSDGAFKVTGKGLEFQPVSNLSELVSNEEAQFRFLVDGKPAAGVKVTVVPGSKKYRTAEEAQELVTGADGAVDVKWPVAGMYWLNATLSDAKPTTPRATERRMSFTTVFEVLAP